MLILHAVSTSEYISFATGHAAVSRRLGCYDLFSVKCKAEQNCEKAWWEPNLLFEDFPCSGWYDFYGRGTNSILPSLD
jgi:hypothetical protein